MSSADIALLVIFVVGAVSGYRQGFLMALFSLAALVLGIIGAFKLLGTAMVWLSSQFEINESILPYVAFAFVFIAILIGVTLLGKIIKISIDRTFLGSIDQAAGSILGILKAAFLLSVVLWIMQLFEIRLPESWAEESWLLPYVEAFAPLVASWIGDYVPFFNDVFT